MNNEYIILSDGSVAITNENGKIKKRSFDDKYYLNEILMYENKIEMLKNETQQLNQHLKEWDGLIFFCKNISKIQPFLIVIETILGFVLGGLFSAGEFIPYGIFHSLQTFFFGSIGAIIFVIGCKIAKSKSKKKIAGFKGAIEEANKLKNTYGKELSELKQKKNYTIKFNT